MGWRSFRAVAQIRWWTKWAIIFGSFILILGSAREVAANCPNGSSAQTITNGTSGQAVIGIMAASTPPCTLILEAGNYSVASGGFTIATGITVRGPAAPGTAVLQVPASQFSVISIWPIGGSCPSNATVEGLTLSGGAWGIFAGADPVAHPGCLSNQISGLTLRNLTLNPGGSNGHVIDFHGVQNSVIDSVTVLPAAGVQSANGIFIESSSNNNIVMNSHIGGSYSQHAIAIQSSSDNVIVGNTISVATAFDGIHMNADTSGAGNLRNRIERNIIVGHKVDGILVNDNSHFNYVGLNAALSLSYAPGSSTPPSQISGTGIWVNNGSNANYLLGNDLSGSPENGIDILTSKSTFLAGNSVHGNWQGGIWVANVAAAAYPSAPAPQDTVLQGNNIFFNSNSGNIFLQGASNSQATFNYLSGAQGGVVASNHTVAFGVQDSASATIFENTVSEVGARAVVSGSSTAVNFFRNRFLKGTNVANPPQTDGRNGVSYAIAPALVQWDGGSFLGGNHWSDFAVSGNPSTTPNTGFIGTAGNVDRFPYQSETLQTAAIPLSVSVLEPVSGSALAAGTKRTVRWIARGCSFVHLYYGSGAGMTLITKGYPNTGYYFWTVPAVAFRSDYFVQVGCADSNDGALGVADNSPAFTIATNDLVLLNPGRATRAANGGTVRVAWKASAAVTRVTIFVRSGGGAETEVDTVTGTSFKDITLPGSVSSSSRVRVRIQDADSSSHQDSVDGYFMVRGTSGSFTTSLSGENLTVGDVLLLEWTGTSSSFTVDLDLVGSTTTSIARNLADFGNYMWLVPDSTSSSASIRATFRNALEASVDVVTSGAFSISRTTAPPPPVVPSNPAAALRDFDGDARSDLAVFRPSTGTWFVRYSSLGYSTASASSFQWGLPGDISVSADFDGDGRIELTVFRPSTGTWFIRFSTQGYAAGGAQALQWGLAGDAPVVADFDGDGRSDLTVFRPSTGTWFIRFSTQGFSAGGAQALQWGLRGDIPISGDFDGDGRSELTVWRPSTGTWFIRYSSLNYSAANAATFQWGLQGDIPLVTDGDSDGRADLTVWRPSNGFWFIRHSSSGYATSAAYQWGLNGDVPTPTDVDADGTTDLAVFRPSNGTWYVLFSSLGFGGSTSYQWGLPGDELPR